MADQIAIGDRVRLISDGDTNPLGHEVIGLWSDGEIEIAWLRWFGGYGFETRHVSDLASFDG